MKEKHRLNNLFEQARSQKPIVELNDIEQVIRSGKRPSIQKLKLGKPGRGFFNPLKLIVMLSIVGLVLVLMLVPAPEQVRGDKGVEDVQEVWDVLAPAPEQVRGDKGSIQVREDNSLVGDTLLRGEVLYLTKEELTKLGFLFNENGFYLLVLTDEMGARMTKRVVKN